MRILDEAFPNDRSCSEFSSIFEVAGCLWICSVLQEYLDDLELVDEEVWLQVSFLNGLKHLLPDARRLEDV